MVPRSRAMGTPGVAHERVRPADAPVEAFLDLVARLIARDHLSRSLRDPSNRSGTARRTRGRGRHQQGV
jgi:hypothetical protein